jgi:hypothetical protein
MATPTRDEVLAELRGLQAGIQKNLATFTFIVAGKTYSGPEALAFVETAIASALAVVEAHTQLRDAIDADKLFRSQNGTTLRALRDMIRLMYQDNVTTLAEFAIPPKKPRAPLSTEAMVARAAKARATRVKRKTLGKRQRLAIKGEVTGVDITPVTTPDVAAKDKKPEQAW